MDIRSRARLLSGIVGRDDPAVHLTIDGVPERVWAELVTANFFVVLGVRAALGRTFLPDEDRTPGDAPAAVISHALWQRRFGGDPAVVNRRVEINKQPFTIVGVTPRGFQGGATGIAYDMWIPMMMQPVLMPGGDRLKERDNHWMSGFGRLARIIHEPIAVNEARSRRKPVEQAARASDGKTPRRRQKSAWGVWGPALPPTSRRRGVLPACGSGFSERMSRVDDRFMNNQGWRPARR